MGNMPALDHMRRNFETGITRDYKFRREQLKKLKSSLVKYESEIFDALRADLEKSPEETWATENGLVIAEINAALRQLKEWMRPEQVSTNLVNFPSRSSVIREPLGVVLIIGPWNYPLYLLLNPLVGAIAAGNCIVLKPSEFAPATDAIMKKIIEDAFPPEYISYVQGEGAHVIPAMMQNFSFNHVFYTGSTSVGKIVYKMAAEKLVPVTLELGGKTPCVVEEDANIAITAKRITGTKFTNAGQMCVAPDYVLVHHSKSEELISALKKTISRFFGEDPSTSKSYGRMINQKQFERVASYLDHATIAYGGRLDSTSRYIQPTLLTDVSPDSAIMKDEIFGPVLPIIPFQTMEEAKAIIDRNSDPLSFYIFTSSSEKEKQWIDAIPAGGVCVNNASWHLTNPNLPFGGRGLSGMGSYHGKYSFETFSHRKALMRTPTWFDLPVKYPPFNGKLKFFKWIIR